MAKPITVPLLDLKTQYHALREEVAVAMQEVIDDQWFIMGPVVKALEAEIASYCHTPHAIGCSSGTDALLLALMAIGVGPGDEVICPSYTFFATAGSIHRLGAKPVFIDIDPADYNLDFELVREAAERCKQLKAIIPVHLFGQMVDMNKYVALGKKLGVAIIEDAAQAIGAKDIHGNHAGERGAIGCFSFFPSKNLGAFGDAGICTTQDDRLAELLDILRVHGMKPKYHHKYVGINARLDALQAAVLRVKLRHLDKWTEGRQRNAAHYDAMFREAGALTSTTPLNEDAFPVRFPEPAPKENVRHIYNQYVIRVPAALRDNLRKELAAEGIGTEVYYPVPLHLQECFEPLGYKHGDLPQTELAAEETIALPIYPELTPEQREFVAKSVVTFVRNEVGAAAKS